MDYAFLFPGQGAQYVGMGHDLYAAHDDIRALFATASAVGGFDVPDLLFNGSIEALSSTDKTQIAVSVVNIAAAYYLQSRQVQPARVAGFSLGEYAAMVIAGVLSVEDALRAVKMRGEIMEAVSRTHDSAAARAGLIAVLGLSRAHIEEALARHADQQAFVAIHNSPVQVVVGGTPAGLDVAATALEPDAANIIRLQVSGPFHTPLMAAAAEQYAVAIADITFRDPVIPLYSNVNGALVSRGAEMKQLCVQQLTQVVEWVQEEEQLLADSAADLVCLEVGPGHVLRGLWRALTKSYPAERRAQIAPVSLAGTRESIDAVVDSGQNT